MREGDFDPRAHAGWLRGTVGFYAPASSHLRDDLMQEALVAMWRAHGTYVVALGDYTTHLHVAARRRMSDVASERKRQLRPVDRHSSSKGEPKRSQLFAVDVDWIGEDPAVESVEDVAVNSTLREAVGTALQSLPADQREYVVVRFYGGLEGARSAGNKALTREWSVLSRRRRLWDGLGGARDVLREQLHYLQTA